MLKLFHYFYHIETLDFVFNFFFEVLPGQKKLFDRKHVVTSFIRSLIFTNLTNYCDFPKPLERPLILSLYTTMRSITDVTIVRR